MQIGDVCRVIKNGHTKPQIGDFVIVTRTIGSSYVEGLNLKTNTFHHYLRDELEVLV